MAATTISWTSRHLPDGRVLPGYTFNPWFRCEHAGSPGCDNCYAERQAPYFIGRRFGLPAWGPGAARVSASEDAWRKPLTWNRAAAADGERRFVFTASWADVFDPKGPPEARARLWRLTRETPWLVWLVLSKRIGAAAAMLPPDWSPEAYPNVVLMGTAVTQPEVDRVARLLLAIPAAAHGLSLEPLLEPVTLPSAYLARGRRACVIVGGETGPRSRPLPPTAPRHLRDQCAAAGLPFHFKWWGDWLPEAVFGSAADLLAAPLSRRRASRRVAFVDAMGVAFYPDGTRDAIERAAYPVFRMIRVGAGRSGRLLDGRPHDGHPLPPILDGVSRSSSTLGGRHDTPPESVPWLRPDATPLS